MTMGVYTKAVLMMLGISTCVMGQNNEDWILTQTVPGESIEVNCTGEKWPYPDQSPPNGYEASAWMGPVPKLTVWYANTTSDATITTIEDVDCPSCEIRLGGYQLYIANFDPSKHIGVYHCMLLNETTQTYFLVKWGINMRGPYFEDLWKEYESNTIIGLSSAGAFLVLAFTIMIVYKFRWQSEEEEEEKLKYIQDKNYGLNMTSDIKNGYPVKTDYYGQSNEGKINPAFVNDSPSPSHASDDNSEKMEMKEEHVISVPADDDDEEHSSVTTSAEVHSVPADESMTEVEVRLRKSSSLSSKTTSSRTSNESASLGTYDFPPPPPVATSPPATEDLTPIELYNQSYNPIADVIDDIKYEQSL